MQRRNNLTAGGWRRWHWLVGETSQALSSIQSHHIDPISFIIHCHCKVMARMARDDVVRIVRCPTRLLVANWLSRIGPPWPSTDRHLSTGGSTVHTTVHHYRVLHYTLLQTATGRTRHCITRCPALWHHLHWPTSGLGQLTITPACQLNHQPGKHWELFKHKPTPTVNAMKCNGKWSRQYCRKLWLLTGG